MHIIYIHYINIHFFVWCRWFKIHVIFTHAIIYCTAVTDIFSFSVCIIKLFLYRPLCGFSPLSESICCSAPGSPHLGISTTPSSPGGTKQHLHKMICLVNPDQGGRSHSTICCILIGHLCPCALWTELKLKSDYSRFTSSKIMLPACLVVEDKSIWRPIRVNWIAFDMAHYDVLWLMDGSIAYGMRLRPKSPATNSHINYK